MKRFGSGWFDLDHIRAGGRQGDVGLTLLAVINQERGNLPDMSTGESHRPADEAIDDFIRHLARRDFSITTRRIRRHFLDEHLQHVQQAAGTTDISVGELMEPVRAAAWLADAADGKTRSRNTLGGPDAAAYSNSMRVRIDTYNAFAEFLCLPDRYDRRPPAAGDYLTPADTERLLHDLAVRRPIHANAATAIRTAAVAALVADTGRTCRNSPGSMSAPCTWTVRRGLIITEVPARSAALPCRS